MAGFDDLMNGINSFPPGFKPPEPSKDTLESKGLKETYTAKYARFVITDDMPVELENIMNECLAGRAILANEQWHFTPDGKTVIVIKYLIPHKKEAPKDPNVIHGRRRVQKLMRKQSE